MQQIILQFADRWPKVQEHFEKELRGMRSALASVGMIEDVKVDYYGTPTALTQVASVSSPEPRQLVLEPWDSSLLPLIEAAVRKSELSFSIVTESSVVRLTLPQMTEETRKQAVQTLHKKAEEAKVSIRKIREELMKTLKIAKDTNELTEDEFFRAQKEVQSIVDEHIELIAKRAQEKEQELLTV